MGTPAVIEATAEQGLKKIAVLGCFTFSKARSGGLETRVPVRRRAKFLSALPVGAKLIVGGALLGVLEHFIGFADLLETGLGIGHLAHVGMKLARQLPVRALDLIGGGATLKAHDFVIVFECPLIPQ